MKRDVGPNYMLNDDDTNGGPFSHEKPFLVRVVTNVEIMGKEQRILFLHGVFLS